MSLSHILAPAPEEPGFNPPRDNSVVSQPKLATTMAAQARPDENAVDTPNTENAGNDEQTSPNEPMYTSTTTSTRRNASGSVSSVYSGNKIRHLKKEDGIPLWRKDIHDGSQNHTFAEVYIDAMAKSSKCSKILKEKLLQDTEGAVSMAMVCLLVNVGRMNTTLNFFPEMRAQLRTYHSIPALQAHQDPNAYKQLQDAPRLKSILKGATEDQPQPSTIEEVKAAQRPRTNPVNLVFVMSQYAPKISEVHFPAPRDFFDLVMRSSLSSASRARAFLWLVWWYLESDFGYEDSQRNPFGAGQYADGDQASGALPLKVPSLESLTEDQAAAENVDTEAETHYGEVKRKERIAILASEPSPAMTALKRARKEKGLTGTGLHSEDEASEQGFSKHQLPSMGRSYDETRSEFTRSPSPAANRGFQAVNTKPGGDMRINNLLNNEDAMSEASPPRGTPSAGLSIKKGPGRGNWRRNKPKPEASTPLATRTQDDRSHHVPLLPNPGQLNFINEVPPQPTLVSTYRNDRMGASHYSPLDRGDHVPTPSYQAQKRHRGVTQHQSAVINHRKQQIDYTLDRRIRRVHKRARTRRESEGAILRAWKRIRFLPDDYDSEEEQIKVRKLKERAEKDDDYRSTTKGKENVDTYDEAEPWRRPRVYLAGFVPIPEMYKPGLPGKEPDDVGEEARSLTKAFQRCSRRLDRWQGDTMPGLAMIRRRQLEAQGYLHPQQRRRSYSAMELDGGGTRRQRSGTGRTSERREEQQVELEPDDEDGGGELDEEDRELLGEVDADEDDLSEIDDDEDSPEMVAWMKTVEQADREDDARRHDQWHKEAVERYNRTPGKP
ncbi:hypothetical protein LTR37_016409 [Vermiconidia calcicola]|uniref:Uncharacterized protein n=1 Tax=Vermiconidia calcicola TaxID=1690605 RepID=A0ACC3MPJ3_9PEZI|nr:hypothetical protein LTR37_016409 [Vermiconidia calcicola]